MLYNFYFKHPTDSGYYIRYCSSAGSKEMAINALLVRHPDLEGKPYNVEWTLGVPIIEQHDSGLLKHQSGQYLNIETGKWEEVK